MNANDKLKHDDGDIASILNWTAAIAAAFLDGLEERPAAAVPASAPETPLSEDGLGAVGALREFMDRFGAQLSGSAGPRYLGFVTGGATPAALAADWLTGVFDQNVMTFSDSIAPVVEQQTVEAIKELLGLPAAFFGIFVTGATMANLTGLASAREWAGEQIGRSVSASGLFGSGKIDVLSGAGHSSIAKALSVLGMGRDSLQAVPMQADREAVDLSALEEHLRMLNGRPAIVVANAGTVNTADFDDLRRIGHLKQRYPFWMHVDAAFGGIAAASPKYRNLLAGWELADSITVDAHKWLNVPYDSALIFTRHKALQARVFQNSAAYLGEFKEPLDFIHLTPENSRRFRALPAWATLAAYGRSGYAAIVERSVESAQALYNCIASSKKFRILAPARLNVVCFTLEVPDGPSVGRVGAFLKALHVDGRAFLTPTTYKGTAAIRAAFANWRTKTSDIETIFAALESAYEAVFPQKV